MILKFGIISSTDNANGKVRVQFDDNDIVSHPLPVLVNGTSNKYYHTFDVNEQVACLMDKNLENGVVLGAIYSSSVQPGESSADVARVQFSDNTVVSYDRGYSELSATVGTTTFKATASGGFEIKKGGESLKNILTDLVQEIAIETHTSASPGSPTTVPLNAANYLAFVARIANLFSA